MRLSTAAVRVFILCIRWNLAKGRDRLRAAADLKGGSSMGASESQLAVRPREDPTQPHEATVEAILPGAWDEIALLPMTCHCGRPGATGLTTFHT